MWITVSHSLAVGLYSFIHVCIYTSLHSLLCPLDCLALDFRHICPAGQSHQTFCLLLLLGGGGKVKTTQQLTHRH